MGGARHRLSLGTPYFGGYQKPHPVYGARQGVSATIPHAGGNKNRVSEATPHVVGARQEDLATTPRFSAKRVGCLRIHVLDPDKLATSLTSSLCH